MREIRPYGSEGGGAAALPTPILGTIGARIDETVHPALNLISTVTYFERLLHVSEPLESGRCLSN